MHRGTIVTISALLVVIFGLGEMVWSRAEAGENPKAEEEKEPEIKGVLVEKGTGRPVAGRQVLLCEAKKTEDGRDSLALSLEYESTTDEKGHFSFLRVRPGTYGLLSNMSQLETVDGKGLVRIVVKRDDKTRDLGRIEVETK